MKLLLTAIFSFFLFTTTLGQTASMTVTQESPLWEKYNAKYNNPAYILDNKLLSDASAKHVLNSIDPFSVIKVVVAYGSTSRNERNVAYITTGSVKIAAYQKKFGAFSSEYKNYLAANNYREGPCFYILNRKAVSGASKDIIDELYNLPAADIIRVDFDLKPASAGNGQMAMINITTKK